MAFQRAQWHSGLTYQQTCRECNTVVQYMDDKLDFRPWYADGFVYCPRCRKPLRHSEAYAINAPTGYAQAPYTAQPVSQPESQPMPQQTAPDQTQLPAFCSQCGNQFGANDRFCSQCGTKR